MRVLDQRNRAVMFGQLAERGADFFVAGFLRPGAAVHGFGFVVGLLGFDFGFLGVELPIRFAFFVSTLAGSYGFVEIGRDRRQRSFGMSGTGFGALDVL